MKIILSILFLLSLAGVGFGQNEKVPFPSEQWKVLSFTLNSSDEDGDGKKDIDTVYGYRLNSIKRIGVDTYKFWIKAYQYKTKEYTMDLWQIKCDAAQYRLTQITSYDANGENPQTTDTPNSKFEDVIPDSAAEMIINKVCKIIKASE